MVLLGLLGAGFVVMLWRTADLFPARVATHFGLDGEANGWMSRRGHLWFMTGFGLGLPVVIVALHYAARFFPNESINLPNKGYWLAPGRRESSLRWVLRHSLWLASLVLAFMLALHFIILQANRVSPPHLPGWAMTGVLGVFLAAVGCWVARLYFAFRRPAGGG